MELKVIDVSKHQGKIDWARVKAHIDGAIIRCGYGQDIKTQDDERFVENVEACIKHGIPFGVYLYSYAKTVDMAKGEAAHVLRLLAPYKGKLSYPVYYDLEEPGTEKTAVERAKAFAKIIEVEGYMCGIYANQHWWQSYLKNQLDGYTKWVAKYSNSKPVGISGTYDMWQYSSKGNVLGINGYVDMNICYRDFQAEKQPDKAEEGVKEVSAIINAYSKKKDGNKKLSANFKVKEFACKDGSDPIFIALELVDILQKVRNHFGKAVVINSAYRTPAYNKKVGGATYSQHLYGMAADIKINGVKPKQVAAYIETLMPGKGGIGIYSTFTHVDVREKRTRWNG